MTIKGGENARALTITNRNIYDHQGRKKEVFQTMSGEPEVKLAQYYYNELGQLVKKRLHVKNDSSYLQGISYRYNIRGWLTSINNAKLDNDGELNDEDHVCFGEELSYNDSLQVGGSLFSSQWNGNISAMKWKTKGANIAYSAVDVSAYGFEYDKLNRMTQARYGSGANGTTWNNRAGFYDETVSYDPMGNIETLQRKTGTNLMDNLSYQ